MTGRPLLARAVLVRSGEGISDGLWKKDANADRKLALPDAFRTCSLVWFGCWPREMVARQPSIKPTL
jgi:hypothetical protein